MTERQSNSNNEVDQILAGNPDAIGNTGIQRIPEAGDITIPVMGIQMAADKEISILPTLAEVRQRAESNQEGMAITSLNQVLLPERLEKIIRNGGAVQVDSTGNVTWQNPPKEPEIQA